MSRSSRSAESNMVGSWIVVLLLCGLSETAYVGETTSYDTIVVGLGGAGTAAASALAKAGKQVLGLEAYRRVGGRVRTAQCPGGVVELGAEWIHGLEGSPTYKLALDNHVDVAVQELQEGAVWSDGTPADIHLISDLINTTLNLAFEPPEAPESVGNYTIRRLQTYVAEKYPDLPANFLPEFLIFADLVVDSYIGCDTWLDATTASSYQELGGSQDMSWHKNGYHTLFAILLNTYKNGPGLPTLRVKLNTEVTQIDWPQDPAAKVVVKTKDGDEFTADNVIVTVSVGVLKERHTTLFSPPLPPKKVTAIETISIGVVDKIVLIFPHRWWPENKYFGFLWRTEDRRAVPQEDQWVTMISGVSPPMGCDEALTLWTNGEAARHIETLPTEVVKSKSIELLRRFLSANYTIPEPTAIYRTTWYSNPFTRGSYSFENVDTPQHPTAKADLAEPLVDSAGHPRVLFAGEATHQTMFSTVHGAVASGQREASRLLNSTEETPKPPGTPTQSGKRGGFVRGVFRRKD